MNFAVFQPPQAKGGKKVPLVTFLSGLTCTEENFTVKAGAQRVAAELGLMLLMPDTSPRGAGYPGEDDAYDFGSGAGFYLDATPRPWSQRYNMYSYVTGSCPRCWPSISPPTWAARASWATRWAGPAPSPST